MDGLWNQETQIEISALLLIKSVTWDRCPVLSEPVSSSIEWIGNIAFKRHCKAQRRMTINSLARVCHLVHAENYQLLLLSLLLLFCPVPELYKSHVTPITREVTLFTVPLLDSQLLEQHLAQNKHSNKCLLDE